jgi:hypothetical protein
MSRLYISKFDVSKVDRLKNIKNLVRSLLDELENLFHSYWVHRLQTQVDKVLLRTHTQVPEGRIH